MFAWDDERDLLDGQVTLAIEAGDEFRERTLDILKDSLGLSISCLSSTVKKDEDQAEGRDVGDAILESFQNLIGPAVIKGYTFKQ